MSTAMNVRYHMLRPVLDALPGQAAILDSDGRIVVTSASWDELAGAELMVGGRPGDAFLSRCDRTVAAAVRDVLAGGRDEFRLDYPWISTDATGWYSICFRPYDDGSLTGALVINEDITTRVQNERSRVETDQMLDALIDASPLAIIVIDTDFLVTNWNTAAEKTFGWTSREVIGRVTPIVQPELHDEFISNLDVALASNQGNVVQVRRRRKDGTLLDVRISYASLYDEAGELRGWMGIIADITDEQRLMDQFQFLSDVSDVLGSSLDYGQTLAQVARMAVPKLADCCSVNLVEEDGKIRRLVMVHRDPDKHQQMQEFIRDYPILTDTSWGSAAAIATLEPNIIQWDDAPPVKLDDGQGRFLSNFGFGSTLCVPMVVRDTAIGSISLAYDFSSGRYTEDDLAVARALAHRAATAIDNARLYKESRDAELQYRAIIEDVPAITYTARADDLTVLTFLSGQNRLPRNFRNDGPELDGKQWETRLHPDDVARVREVMADCTATGKPLEVEYRVVEPDGEVSWRLDRANLILNEDGLPQFWQGVVIDLTDRRIAEQAIRARARQQAAVAELGYRSVAGRDLDDILQDAATVVQETLEVEYVTFALHDPEAGGLKIVASAGKKLASGGWSIVPLDTPSLLTYTFISGSPVVVEDLGKELPFTPWQGMTDAGVQSAMSVIIPGPDAAYGVIMAASEKKQPVSPEDVNFLQAIGNMVSAAIEHSRDEMQVRFQAHLLDVISQAVIATDREGRITSCNRHAEQLYGWDRDDMLGRVATDVLPLEIRGTDQNAVLQSALAGEPWSGDVICHRRDGSTFNGWVLISPIREQDGTISGLVGVSADITDRIQANQERERLLTALGERVKEMTVLHRAASLFEGTDTPLEFILSELAGMLPSAMQRPERVSARVQVGGQWASSPGYRATPWSIRSRFRVPGGGRGTIEVGYHEPCPRVGDDLFLSEEVSLLESLAEMFHAYLQRIDSRARLEHSETRFRAATAGTLNAFSILEPVLNTAGETVDYRFVEVNSRAEMLLQLPREQLIGHTLREQFLPQQASMFIDAFNQVQATGETIEREVEVPRESDSFWMLFQAVPLEDGIAAFASETTAQRMLEQQLVHQAFHDSLTGLPNRALFLDRVDHARTRVRRRHEGLAVLFLDLDNFKIVNDSLGHTAGDELLVLVSDRLQWCIGGGNTAARLGGDEFAILLEDLADWGSVDDVAHTIIHAFEAPFSVQGREVYITPSIGVAIATNQSATASDLLRDADAAMYRAKRNGKARVEVFEPSLSMDIIERFELEHDMRRAIDSHEFSVVYQPIIGLGSGEVMAFEALARWEHPEYGQIPPATFIPIAEETGLIIPLGLRILHTACQDAVAWNRDRPGENRVRVSVNISARQFRHSDLVEHVITALRGSGLEGRDLYLEITESLMVEEVEQALETLSQLQALGVHVAVDDFGIGYSSLGSLRQFPVEVVKIDRTFVSGVDTNPQDAVMFSSIISLAHALGLLVVAEGVETASQRDRLRAMGCDMAQGFFFAHPTPAENLFSLLQ